MNHLSLLEQVQVEKWKTISDQFHIDTICVFGSITTEAFHEESDIDFAIIGNKAYSLKEKISIELSLEDLFHREIDVIDLNDVNLDIFVKIQALDDGVTVFTKDNEQSLERCREDTEHYYRINRSFFAKRRRELLS